MEQVKVGFVGAGAVGETLARAFASVDVPVVAITDRSVERADTVASDIPGCTAYTEAQFVLNKSDLVFLTVPDDSIRRVCDDLEWTSEKSVVHCSGALSLDVLSSASEAGAQTGACHPFQTFVPTGNPSEVLAECMFGVEAEGRLESVLDDVIRRVGGWSVSVRSGDRATYHLAGVVVSNYLVTLASTATDLLQAIGVNREDALRGLLPILRGTVRNLDSAGLPSALTGPVARGDTQTVQRHLVTMSKRHPELLSLYIALGRHTLSVAQARGSISDSTVKELEDLFDEYQPR